jgi:glycosyltransferase involved in cell wall biosynthesis
VAILSEYPRARDRVVGGLEAVSRDLARALAARPGLEVHVVSFHAGLAEEAEEDVEGVRVHRFPLPRRLGNVTLGAMERRTTARRLRRIRPDVVHALGLGPKALAAADTGVPWLVSVNGIQSIEARVTGGWKNRVRASVLGGMENAALRRATDVIVPSDVVAGMIRDRAAGARIHTVENSVAPAFFEIRGSGDPSRVLCVGRLLPLKAPQDLIEAARLRAAAGRAIRVRFVGPADDPWFLEGLRERVRAAGLGALVDFLGFVADERLRAELAEAGLLVHPSRVEIAPLAVMQAMAAGRPVVATDVGGTGRLIDPGRTGLLVPPGQPTRLARAIAVLQDDPSRARTMGEAGRTEAEARFRIERHVDRVTELYRQVVNDLDSTGSKPRNPIELMGFTRRLGNRSGAPEERS